LSTGVDAPIVSDAPLSIKVCAKPVGLINSNGVSVASLSNRASGVMANDGLTGMKRSLGIKLLSNQPRKRLTAGLPKGGDPKYFLPEKM
jgi:hypothetical protein